MSRNGWQTCHVAHVPSQSMQGRGCGQGWRKGEGGGGGGEDWRVM